MANKNQVAVYPHKVRTKWYFLTERVAKIVNEVCDLYCISRKTYYKWKRKDLGSRAYTSKKEHPDTKRLKERLRGIKRNIDSF